MRNHSKGAILLTRIALGRRSVEVAGENVVDERHSGNKSLLVAVRDNGGKELLSPRYG